MGISRIYAPSSKVGGIFGLSSFFAKFSRLSVIIIKLELQGFNPPFFPSRKRKTKRPSREGPHPDFFFARSVKQAGQPYSAPIKIQVARALSEKNIT